MASQDLGYRIYVIHKRMEHHSAHSGYDRVSDYFDFSPGKIMVDKASYLVRKIYGRIRQYNNKDWYFPASLKAELEVLRRSLFLDKSIYHFIYGDDDFRYAGWAKKINKNARIVSTYHQPPDIFEKVVHNKMHLKTLDAIIAVGTNQLSYFQDLAGKEKVFFVPHGIDTAFFRPPLHDHKYNGNRVCLFVGQWQRDFQCLRRVVRLISERNRDVVFQIITSKDYKKELQGLPNIRIHSDISEDELLAAYQSATIMILPLLNCTANNAVLEAMASGLAIVTTDIGGIRDYLDDNCAFLVTKGDYAAMAETVLLLLNDENLRLRKGKAAREKAVAEFEWGIVANKLLRVYEEVFCRL